MVLFSGFKNTVFLLVLTLISCGNAQQDKTRSTIPTRDTPAVITGAERTDQYFPMLKGKQVAVVANQTSIIPSANNTHVHLVDSLLNANIRVTKVFAPEHGFRGEADAGEHVQDGIDQSTGLPIVSLYGKNRKPNQEQLEDVDVILFDIQDVGVRFYTYIATLQLVMEAAAEAEIPLIVLDRPNPNAHYIDGPTMEEEHRGFLGMNSIPLVYGMTIGEYALMVNGEGWLGDELEADLSIITLQHYDHQTRYSLPVRPSPNLPNDRAINLYPSLGLFEGTNINAGRGTEAQFQRYGASFLDSTAFDFSYVPQPNPGAKHPKEKGEKCFGRDLSHGEPLNMVNLEYLMDAYANAKDKSKVFNSNNFTRHAGTAQLQKQIEKGMTAEAIRNSWKKDLDSFKKLRRPYLLYN